MKIKRYVLAILIAWILFIGVDFLFHASIFASLWKEDIAIFKSLESLSLLIPAGYLSFLLITILIGYLFFRIFEIKPPLKEAFKFALIFGILFSLSNLLGLFSYIAIPVKQLLLFNLVYFIEIIVVTLSLYFIVFSVSLKKVIWRSSLIFITLIIAGIVIQNVL
ncbi:MAG: hypothetical protein ACXWWD_05625 [Chitinophagaceae bacterium]